jgi:disulfide bond formation protein DsbB
MGALTARRWPIVALLASLAMLAAAHAFQRFAGLTPCALCLTQRDVYWGAAAVAIAALALVRFRPDAARLAALALGLVFLLQAAVALYHVAVEQHWVTARCDAADLSDITTLPLSGSFEVPKCDDVQWSLFGVSMAGYNAIVALLLSVGGFVAGLRRA